MMSMFDISMLIADKMGVSWSALISPNKAANLVKCRRMIFYILHERGHHEKEISHILMRDRTTIRHHIEVMQSYLEIYPSERELYQRLKRKITLHEIQTKQSTARGTEDTTDKDDQSSHA